ncbi:MAG: thiamine pyrophosphate-dependent enzyme, partial [Nocardioides sp.]
MDVNRDTSGDISGRVIVARDDLTQEHQEPPDQGPLIGLLDPSGARVRSSDVAAELADGLARDFPGEAEAELVRGLCRDMVLLRRFDIEATALQRHGELGIWSQVIGQEAANIGAGRALRAQDVAFPTYRDHGLAWCKGVDPIHVLELFRGVNRGGWDARATNVCYPTIVIGAHALHATGYAMAVQRDGCVGTGEPDRDTAVLAAFGDGATAQGDVNEALVFAASYHAPVVFFCQNNHWAISEPTDLHLRAPIYRRGVGFGVPGVRVDGNDVLATYAVVRAALQRARAGQGPTLIEAVTYRMGAHTTTDDPTRYRNPDEIDRWRRRDPITRVASYLRSQSWADGAFFEDLDRRADELGHTLREGCKAIPAPDPLRMFDEAYAEIPADLLAQRAAYAAYLDSFVAEAGTEVGTGPATWAGA